MQSSNGDTDIREQTSDTAGVEGEGGMYGENNMETSSCVKHIANGNLLYDSGNSKLGLGNNPEKWDAEGGGRDVQLGGNTDKPMTNSC